MPEERLLLESVKLVIRGFESRRAPKAYRQWFGFVLRDAKRTVHLTVCENVLSQDSLSFGKERNTSADLSAQCKSEPCLGMDTVFSQSVPKDFFPRRAGSTQIFSRCFCMNDSEAASLPSRRITYYEKDNYQRKSEGLSLQKRQVYQAAGCRQIPSVIFS